MSAVAQTLGDGWTVTTTAGRAIIRPLTTSTSTRVTCSGPSSSEADETISMIAAVVTGAWLSRRTQVALMGCPSHWMRGIAIHWMPCAARISAMASSENFTSFIVSAILFIYHLSFNIYHFSNDEWLSDK